MFFSKHHLLPVFTIVGLTFLVWHKVLGQTFLGESYSYFAPYWDFFVGNSFPNFDIWYYNNFARFIFDILPPLLGDNLQLYLLFQLLTFLAIYLSLYFVLYKITNSKMVGFSAAIFFMSNYITSFEMMATGNYQRFGERVANFIPTIVSFYYLIKFYNQKKIGYLIISLLLYCLAVVMSHFNTILLPLLIVYPLLYWLTQSKKMKYFLIGLAIAFIFAMANFYLISKTPMPPRQSFVSFLLTEDHLLEKIFYQLPYLTFPYDVIKVIAKIWPEHLLAPYTSVVEFLLVPTLLLYGAGAVLAFKRNKVLFSLYLTAFLGGILSMVLYMYIDNRLNVLISFGEDRHFFVTALFLSITWAVLLKVLFSHKLQYQLVAIFLLTAFVIYNTNYIWRNMDGIQYKSEMMKRYITYIKSISYKFNKDTVIFVPSHLLWPAPMITSFYGNPQMKFVVFPDEGVNSQKIKDEIIKNKDNVYVIDYDFGKEAGKDYDPAKGKVIDLTDKIK